MKLHILLLLVGCCFTGLAFSQEDHLKLCHYDSLSVREAYGRMAWTAVCSEKDVQIWFDRFAGPTKLSGKEKLEYSFRYWLYFAGMKRTKPLYPIYSDGSDKGWIAPTITPFEMEHPECIGVPGGMSIHTTCGSERNDSRPHRVSRKELLRPMTEQEREDIRRIFAGQLNEEKAKHSEQGKEISQ